MKKWSCVWIVLAVILSNIMCFNVAYQYRGLLCGIEHGGFSAPAEIAFLSIVPYGLGIMTCIVLAIVFYKKK